MTEHELDPQPSDPEHMLVPEDFGAVREPNEDQLCWQDRVEDLIWHDGPCLSVFQRKTTQVLYLWLWVDSDDETNQWLILPVAEEDLALLREGETTLWEIIDQCQDPAQLADFSKELHLVALWSVQVSDLPNSYLPDVDSYLPGTRKSGE
jgi:hypothetical protein